MKRLLLGAWKIMRLYQILVDYYFVITLFAFIAAGVGINTGSILVFFSYLASTVFIFSYNDVEDADDDALHPKKALRNPVSAKIITPREGTLISFTFAILAIILAILTGIWQIILIAIILVILDFFYNWRGFRLKAMPVVDVLSHLFTLSVAYPLMLFYLPDSNVTGASWIILVGLGLFSAAGDLYNEIRDFKVDQEAGLKNTANLLGYKTTRVLAISLYGLAIIFIIAGTIIKLFAKGYDV